MLGNFVENAAKYGGGRVFVTVKRNGRSVDIEVEDDGTGIPAEKRGQLFSRGARLDTTGKPGTGLGLAIVRDVAEIYGGSISLEESEDLGGLLARLTLPAAESRRSHSSKNLAKGGRHAACRTAFSGGVINP